jgi:hypothetical protein
MNGFTQTLLVNVLTAQPLIMVVLSIAQRIFHIYNGLEMGSTAIFK